MLSRVRDSLRQFFDRPPLTPRAVPLLILGMAAFAFSIKTLNQGFFHDDWHHIYYAHNYGAAGLKQFLFYDSRPFAYAVYVPLFRLLGFQATHWHLLVLVLRFLTVWIFFLCLNLLWPEQKKANGLVATLFLIYPVFQVQPNAVSYALHWVTYLIFILSFLFMFLAIRRPASSILFTLASLLSEVFHLLMIEYFAGIELARPLLLWFALRELPARERLRKVWRTWLPYFVVLLLYAVFRASFSELMGYDRNSPVILFGLFRQPFQSILFLVQSSLRDLVDILLTAWNATYDPATIDFSIFTNVWIWAFAVLTAIASWLVFSLMRDSASAEEDSARWARSMLGLGLIFVILGLLPTWISGRSFFQLYNLFDDRLALPSMFGASMVWVGAVFYLIKRQAHRILIVCIMLGLAVGLQLRTNTEYARVWQKQSQFYWQLFWRAPYIEPGTAFISDGEIFPFMGIHPTSYAINLIYPANPSVQKFNYAFFASGERIGGWEEFRQGSVLSDERFGTTFQGSSRDTLTILYAPENSQCLWILRPQDAILRNLPELTYQSLPASNPGRIQRESLAGQSPPEVIFGDEPAHTWCFYYQKAELARQYKDWSQVTQLWQEAKRAGLMPGNGAELLVFIEAFATTNDWASAEELSILSSKYGNNIRPSLCDQWSALNASLPSSSDKQSAYQTVTDKLRCNGLQ